MERTLSQSVQRRLSTTAHGLGSGYDRAERRSIGCSDGGTLSDTASQYSWKSPAKAVVRPRSAHDVDGELDIAPVDQPPEIQAQQDREPFAILARHLSGVSAVSKQETLAECGNAPQPFDPPPDGGFKAWSVVMGAWFVLFVQFGISTYTSCKDVHILIYNVKSRVSASLKNTMPRISYPICQSRKYRGAARSRHSAYSSSVFSAADTLMPMDHASSLSEERQQVSSPYSALHVSCDCRAMIRELTLICKSVKSTINSFWHIFSSASQEASSIIRVHRASHIGSFENEPPPSASFSADPASEACFCPSCFLVCSLRLALETVYSFSQVSQQSCFFRRGSP